MSTAGILRIFFAIAGRFSNLSGGVNPQQVHEFCFTLSKVWATPSSSRAMSRSLPRAEVMSSWKSSPVCIVCWRERLEQQMSFVVAPPFPRSTGSARF